MIMIIAFFVVIGGLFIAVWLFVVFCWWVLKQATEANKYRKIMEVIASQGSVQTGNSWEVSYKMNGVARTMAVEGDTEESALREFILKGGSPRGVTGVRKV